MKALLLLLAVSGSALASDADLLRCRSIADVAGRVACYDAIPVATAVRPAAASGVAAAMPVAPSAPAAKPDPTANFGLSATQLRKSDEPTTIESTLIGTIDGWSAGTLFKLANGQIWRVADDSAASISEVTNPKVRISRNGIGTIFLEIEGANQAPRVRRLQ